MKMTIGLAFAALAGLAACAAPSAPQSQTAGPIQVALAPQAGKMLPIQDGVYKITTDGCANGAHFEVHNGIASFTSPFSGARAESPVGADGSFNLVTPPNINFGVTSLRLDAGGTGQFKVENRYQPCSSRITSISREN